MEFQTTSALKRPVRLPAWLRRWAWESMHGKYGTEAMQTPYIEIEDERFEALSDIDKYDRMIKEIAARAPIRICEEEMVSGSATLGAAIQHVVPAFYKKEKVFFSVSHLTLDYATALHRGIEYYAAKISEKLQDASLSERQKRFLQSLTNVIESLKIYHGRYLKAAKDCCRCPSNRRAIFTRRCNRFGFCFPLSDSAATGRGSGGSTGCWGNIWSAICDPER